jgi:lipopolysaccharide transport system ATP-binding protein
MSTPIITVENLTKSYSVYQNPRDIIIEMLTGKKRHDDFWALNGVSFTLHEKERLGIIGANGSGKSTLLKILTGHLRPTSGNVHVNGNISAMLSLNTVLNPEETGISNIRFNLLLGGAIKSEIDELIDDIVEFTELGQFIYAPVKTYSSGMNAKLAFAINTAIRPDILVIDEVLSVGDAYFVGKATKRMVDMCDKGKGLIFVSHSNSAVQMLCDKVLWLDNGSIRMLGPAEYVLKAYEEDYRFHEDIQTRAGNARRHKADGGNAVPGEMRTLQNYRIRLRQISSKSTFEDTHYIRRISFSDHRQAEHILDLGLTEMSSINIAPCIDILESEWGRLYTKQGNNCRILSSRTGRNKGGQVLIPALVLGEGDIRNIELNFEYISLLGKERLGVEILDYRTGEWFAANDLDTRQLEDGWMQTVATLEIPLISEDSFHQAAAKVQKSNRPDLEICTVELHASGKTVNVLSERQQFCVVVKLNANQSVPVADIGIKIMRIDGVYAFWQSSGMNGGNLTNLDSAVAVTFHFDVNCFSAGDYLISAYVANGWNYPSNYPYSEVYDRKVNILAFSVLSECPGLDFGIINQRVPVSIHLEESI